MLKRAVLALTAILTLALASCGEDREERSAALPAAAPAVQPVYAAYDFGRVEDGVVNLGVQPMWAPTNAITEAMRRDRILAEELSREGLSLRQHGFFKGADLAFFLNQGQVQAGVAGEGVAIGSASAGEVVIPILIHQGTSALIATRPMTVRDLRGQRVGHVPGTSASFGLMRALGSEGLKPGDVTLAPMDITEMPAALEEGRVAAFSSWEPNTTILLNRHRGYTVIHRAEYTGYLFFRRDFVADHPRAARLILAAQLRAMGFMRAGRANLEEAARWGLLAWEEMAQAGAGVSVGQFAALIKSDLLDLSPTPLVLDTDLVETGRLYGVFEMLKAQGTIPSDASWDKVRKSFDKTLLLDVLAAPQVYRLGETLYTPAP